MIEQRKTSVTYQGDGSTAVFPFSFDILSAANVHVRIYDAATGTKTELAADEYAVDETGKSVVYPSNTSKPKLPRGKSITVYRQTPVNQLTDLGGNYPLPEVEKMVDKVTAILQEHADALSRCVKWEEGNETTPDTLVKALKEAVAKSAEHASQAAQSADRAALTDASAQSLIGEATELKEAAERQYALVEQMGSLYGALARPYDASRAYAVADVVVVEDGSAYRCIEPVQGEYPPYSSSFVAVSIATTDALEKDVDGDLVPCLYAKKSPTFEVDADGDLVPCVS